MRVYFIKAFTLEDGRTVKPGQDVTMWDATQAINSGCAVPYDQRKAYESHAEKKTTPQGPGAKKGTPKKTKSKN